MPQPPVNLDPALLLPSWQLSLRADRKSPQTLKSYSDGVRLYLAWCTEHAADPLDRASLRGWVSALLEGGSAPATARARQLAVRRFTAWLVEEGEIPADPFLGIKAPRLDTGVVQPLTDDQLRALLRACQPPSGASPAETLRHRRDEAMLRLMLESGARAGEVVGLQVADLDLPAGTAVIRRGKGGKGRIVPFGPATARALDRYLRLRARHRLAGTAALWVGDRRQGLHLRRPAQDAQTARRRRRHPRVPPAPDAAHRRPPMAGGRWLGGRPDGRRRLDSPRHAAALHQGAGRLSGRGRGPHSEPGGTVKRTRPERRERAHESEVRNFWPHFAEDDERLYDLTKAYIQATSDRHMQVARPRGARPDDGPQWRPMPPSTTRPLLRVVCTHPEHLAHERPMLAELWHTDAHGPLFLSKLPGAAFDPPDDSDNLFGPPSAVLGPKGRAARRSLPARNLAQAWTALPVTVVRLFLDDPSTFEARLWIKCADHGVGTLDRGKLGIAYMADAKRRREGRDAREPTVIGLHTVGAVGLP